MRSAYRLALALALVPVVAMSLGGTFSIAVDPSPGRTHATVDEALRASGLEGVSLTERSAAVSAEIEALAELVGRGDPSYRRARRLHRTFHERYLREYVPESDSIDRLVTDGRYNCLSATLIEALAARELGIEAFVLEAPGHIWLELRLDSGDVQIETTSRGGFDIERQLRTSMVQPFVQPEVYRWLHWPPTQSSDTEFEKPARYSAEQAVGFVWLNAGWRALAQGDPVRAATCVRSARRLLPHDAMRSEAADRLLARAYGAAYEVGDFVSADTIARLGLILDPGSTTSIDRVLATGLKRIEAAAETEGYDVAQSILDELAQLGIPVGEFSRLERRAYPLIAAAAVRARDWEIATQASERYSRVEPDEVEVRRLAEWIVVRRTSRAAAVTCEAPTLGAAFLSGPR